jgi:hypothetical protein
MTVYDDKLDFGVIDISGGTANGSITQNTLDFGPGIDGRGIEHEIGGRGGVSVVMQVEEDVGGAVGTPLQFMFAVIMGDVADMTSGTTILCHSATWNDALNIGGLLPTSAFPHWEIAIPKWLTGLNKDVMKRYLAVQYRTLTAAADEALNNWGTGILRFRLALDSAPMVPRHYPASIESFASNFIPPAAP